MGREIIRDHFVLCGNEVIERNSRLKSAKAQGKMFHGELYEKTHDGYGNPILKYVESNTVVIGGAILALQKISGISTGFMPPSINERYAININGVPTGNNQICLFGCGLGGAGLDFGNVKAPDIKQVDVAGGLIPLRYGADLVGDEAPKYFFKHDNNDGTFSWLLKEFDEGTQIRTLWKNAIDSEEDGAEITTDVSDSEATDGIESFVEYNISLNSNDVREHFEAMGNLSQARYNCFGFYSGEKINDEYANVRLFSTVNFNNRDVSVKTTSSFAYRIYSLI